VKYAFVAEHRPIFSVRAMCGCLSVQPSGFYAWRKAPLSRRAREDHRQTELIRTAWNDSANIYGYRKLHDDLMDMGETCCPNRVARLAQIAGIRAQIGYRKRPGKYGGKPSLAVDNTLDLFSRRVVGWAMQGRQTNNVVLQAPLAAVWRRKPKNRVLVHSDQGSQFTRMEWASFLKHHNPEPSMSRRGNCHDDAVAESFFNLLKRGRIRRKVYRTRAEARQDMFDYIEMFYNPTRKHARNGMLSPVEFERQHKTQSEGVWKTRGDSLQSGIGILGPVNLAQGGYGRLAVLP
jgi:putative transposase